ncbi:hypothetical protein ACGFIG_23965 [Micromonospora sp. NPDC049048]|uniref:hypothetical protein n=1 Tax=Micromonospora sp. NPDC049048 TaxID=3364263 RepID=UPI00371294A0
MLASFGASAGDLLIVLAALTRWSIHPDDDHVVTVTHDEALDNLLDYTDLGESPDVHAGAAALTMITSTVTNLRDADWRPWQARSRARRLLVQPLAELPDGTIIIAPNFCYAATSVYLRCFSAGHAAVEPEPPAPVSRALVRFRDDRNKALEDDLADLLSAAGYSTLNRVKETAPQRIGILAGRPGSRTIWLLAFKDPADTFVTPEVRRHLDTGHQKSPAYLTQLQRKLADLTPYGAQIVARLHPSLQLTDGDYTMRPLFGIRRPVPAAFAGGPIPFHRHRWPARLPCRP